MSEPAIFQPALRWPAAICAREPAAYRSFRLDDQELYTVGSQWEIAGALYTVESAADSVVLFRRLA